MKIAFIISDKANMTIGDCLSSAKTFEVFDHLSKSYYELVIPDNNKHVNMAKDLALFLQEHNINYVIGSDLGPKAKAALEEKGIKWMCPSSDLSKKGIIKQVLSK
ncbi:MAG: hypothetical protein B7C24_13815 [Bacteroidetes bacterium 4572_77]|nr:MAG: hypothetical protein B7C24_13815 [Bacteroidetes bacterium 4572_77]